jgi:hypothetical protein
MVIAESSDRSTRTPVERTSAALEQLVIALRRTVVELEQLIERADVLRAEVDSGVPLGTAIAAEERPLIITRLVRVTDLLHEVGGEVRRAEAHQLRAEGYTQEGIAQAFGVTRQRAAALLRPPPADPRGPRRPLG